MAVTRVSYHVLAVGQGNGTLVVYYDGAKIVDLAIMDFGSDITTISQSGVAALGYAVSAVQQMQRDQQSAARISAVFFSHSDFDHISLMAKLFEFFPEGRSQLQIEGAFYSGVWDNYEKRSGNVLELLECYMTIDTEPQGFPANCTSFPAAGAAEPVTTVQGFRYFVLVGNTASPTRARSIANKKKAASSYAINTESLVIVSGVGDLAFVMAGDATAQTLKKAADVMRTSASAATLLNQTFHATIPHHGSETTTATTRGLGRGGNWKTTLNDYTRRLQARSVSVTAGVENEHKHPSAAIVSHYWDYVLETGYVDPALDPTGLHLTTQYYDPDFPIRIGGQVWPPKTRGPFWETVQTKAAIFTNHYWEQGGSKVLPPLPATDATVNPAAAATTTRPREVHWEFRLDLQAGTVTVHRHDSTAAAAVGRSLLLGQPGALAAVPAWGDMERQAGATTPVMSFSIRDLAARPRRRPRPGR